MWLQNILLCRKKRELELTKVTIAAGRLVEFGKATGAVRIIVEKCTGKSQMLVLIPGADNTV